MLSLTPVARVGAVGRCLGGARGYYTWPRFERWQDREADTEEYHREETGSRIPIGGPNSGFYITRDNPADSYSAQKKEAQNRKPLPMDYTARHTMLKQLDFSFDNLRRLKRYKNFQIRQYDQRYLPERQLALGSELSAAHFIIRRGGAVKFLHDDAWYKADEYGEYGLPGEEIPGVFVEAIDASNTELMFEGLENFSELRKCRMLRLANCKYMNDWALSRLTQFEATLEYLDLSNCRRITARGLAGVSCLKKLKSLRLHGLGDTTNVAKVCLQLEEVIPGLHVEGVDLDAALDDVRHDLELREQPEVLEDARGNLFTIDDSGEPYILGGRLPSVADRQPTVDDFDAPLIISSIRKDPPELPLDTLERLDALSDGKLRHSLIGSPSGYRWTDETDRVLRFQLDLRRRRGNTDSPHPFLLPKEERERLKLTAHSNGATAQDEHPLQTPSLANSMLTES